MKERTVDRERTVVSHDQASEVSEPGVGAFDNPSPFVATQGSAILRRGSNAISLVRADQFDPATDRCRTLCRRSPAAVSVVDGPPDDTVLPGSPRASFPRA